MRYLSMLALLLVGCGAAAVTGESSLYETIRPSAESRVWIIKPADKGKPFSPGETLECAGKFTVGPSHRLLSVPKITILSGRATADQVRAEPREQEPNGEVPFEAKLKCPKKPGKYTLRATFVVGSGPEGKDGKPARELVIQSSLIHFEVKGKD